MPCSADFIFSAPFEISWRTQFEKNPTEAAAREHRHYGKFITTREQNQLNYFFRLSYVFLASGRSSLRIRFILLIVFRGILYVFDTCSMSLNATIKV